MNQQRSRRFRSAQEAKEKDADKAEHIKMLKQQHGGVLPEGVLAELDKKTWDSNSITPGTPFMDTLASSLRYWVAYKLNTDPAWEKLKIIISDATVPGEGEHKIMNFIRSQRSSPEHDPNTRHVIYGLDADLIMLGLATHEPHFRVLREDVFFDQGKARTCKICGQTGHKAEECRGEAKKKSGDFDEKGVTPALKPFIWLHVGVLREYLAIEMEVPNMGFKFDLERALDDWVFMCFFVGNDFLPHLPSLDIREQGIDTLIAIWRDNMPTMGGYLTKDGFVDLKRAQIILQGLAKQEDAIFKRRKQVEEKRDANQKRRNQESQNRQSGNFGGGKRPRNMEHAPLNAADLGAVNLDDLRNSNQAFQNRSNNLTHEQIMNRGPDVQAANTANKSAAAVLKEKLKSKTSQTSSNGTDVKAENTAESVMSDVLDTPPSAAGKRKRDLIEDEDRGTPGRKSPEPVTDTPKADPDEPPPDTVRLWEEGYGDRYYEQKFGVSPSDHAFRHKVARAYTEGLAWVLLYYFQGCSSWTWYYPYHYAPFAADFVDIGDMELKFEKGNIFKPYEQLMGVLPAASNHAIPEVFRSLMTDEDSDIVDFYPEDFHVDLNGKKFAWQGVAILPFIDEKRLLKAMATRYPLLTPDEHRRNEPGKEVLLFSERHPLYESVATNFYSKKKGVEKFKLNMKASEQLAGTVEKNPDYMPASSLVFPLPEGGMPDVDEDKSISVFYEMPKSIHVHKSMILKGVQFPTPMLDQLDIQKTREQASTSGRSFGGVRFDGNGRGGRGGGGGGRGRGGYGGQIDYRANQGAPDRSNPYAAGLNPQFFQNGGPPQQHYGAQVWPTTVPAPPPPGVGGYGAQPQYGAQQYKGNGYGGGYQGHQQQAYHGQQQYQGQGYNQGGYASGYQGGYNQQQNGYSGNNGQGYNGHGGGNQRRY